MKRINAYDNKITFFVLSVELMEIELLNWNDQ